MNERQQSNWLTAVLGAAALGCGLWAIWPNLFPTPHPPMVTRHDLPPVVIQTSPEQAASAAPRATSSIQPYSAPLVQLNSATEAEIEALPGVGPALAQRIVDGRPYASLADLDHVKGIGPKLLARLAPLVQIP